MLTGPKFIKVRGGKVAQFFWPKFYWGVYLSMYTKFHRSRLTGTWLKVLTNKSRAGLNWTNRKFVVLLFIIYFQ